MVVELPLPDRAERLLLWQEALADLTETGNTLPTLAAQFPFTGEQIHIVADQFRHTVPLAADGRSAERLKQLCRAHLPTRVPGVIESDPQRTWDDLVLPSDIRAQLEELCGQARHRSTVLGQWGFDRKPFATRSAVAKCLHPDYQPTAAEQAAACRLFNAWATSGKRAAQRKR
jgi:hypothetical protein